VESENPIHELFDELIEDEIEKRIMKLIISGKQSDEILKSLLGKDKTRGNDD
jgi:hypothetical protein